jgi:hypothetical protein
MSAFCGHSITQLLVWFTSRFFSLIGRIFPLSLFIGSLIVAFWYPLIADKLWWGAFATPLLIHLVRSQSWVKPLKEKVAFDQEDETGRRQ